MNLEYTCEICNYKTDRPYNLKLHEKSIKHLKNVGKMEYNKMKKTKIVDNIHNLVDKNLHSTQTTFIENQNIKNVHIDNEKYCNNYDCVCGKDYKSYKALWRHKKTCKLASNQVITKSDYNALKSELSDMKALMTTLISKQPTSAININMNNTNNTNNSVNTMNMMSAIKYINQNYVNTQPLKLLDSTNAKTLLLKQASDNHSVEEFMVYYYDKCLFDKFIGEIIKDEYIQKNPEDQQFWTTDVSRLSFVVRRVMQENEGKWIKEPEGKLLKKYIISPILVEVKKMIDDYNIYCKEKMYVQRATLKLLEMEKLGDAIMTCKKISSDIGNQLFDEPVLRYIAPYFKLDII